MEYPGGVDKAQSCKERRKQFLCLLPGYLSGGIRQVGLEGDTVYVFEHGVGGVVLTEHVKHRLDVGHSAQLHQRAVEVDEL